MALSGYTIHELIDFVLHYEDECNEYYFMYALYEDESIELMKIKINLN